MQPALAGQGGGLRPVRLLGQEEPEPVVVGAEVSGSGHYFHLTQIARLAGPGWCPSESRPAPPGHQVRRVALTFARFCLARPALPPALMLHAAWLNPR